MTIEHDKLISRARAMMLMTLIVVFSSCSQSDDEKARDIVMSILRGEDSSKYWIPRHALPAPETTGIFDLKNSINNTSVDVSNYIKDIKPVQETELMRSTYAYGGKVPDGYIAVSYKNDIEQIIFPYVRHGNRLYILHSWLKKHENVIQLPP